MLKDIIRSDFITARKTGDALTKSALEAVIAEMLRREKLQVGHVVEDNEAIECVSKEIKVQREIIEYSKNVDVQKTQEAENKIAILTKYLPKQLTEEEVLELVKKADVYEDASPRTKGMIIKTVMPQIAGKFDKSKVNGIVENYLANK